MKKRRWGQQESVVERGKGGRLSEPEVYSTRRGTVVVRWGHLEIQARLDRLANESGRATDQFVQDAMPGDLDELERTREMLDTRYDDIKSGRVQPSDGEEAFARLREKSEARHHNRG